MGEIVHGRSTAMSPVAATAGRTDVSPRTGIAAHTGLLDLRGDALRVMTLNLWCEPDERSERHRLAGRLAALLNVDVLAVQEVANVPFDETLGLIVEHSDLQVVAVSAASAPPVREGTLHTAVLSRLPARAHEPIRFAVPGSSYDRAAAAAVIRSRAGRDLLAVSAHLAWGGLAEHERISQAARLDHAVSVLLADGSAPAVLAGDFNTLPSSATLRFLTGLDPFEGRCAQWVDSFAVAGVGSGVSSSGSNSWARLTASRHGFLDPGALPERRIDYVMVRGYAYGRPFAPLRSFSVPAELCGALLPETTFPPSDHDPVVADLWDPASVTGS